MMFPKQGKILAPEYLAWVRSQPCIGDGCGAPPPSEAHHFPPKGRRRDIDDTRTMPVCRACHKQCGGEVVVVRGKRYFPVPASAQVAAVDATFRRFVAEAPREVVDTVLAKMRAGR